MALSKHATILVTDVGFLMPSTFLALQVSQRAARTQASDVFVAICGASAVQIEALEQEFGAPNLKFVPVDEGLFDLGNGVVLGDTHISAASLGRLFLDAFLPAEYTDILYLDGDMQLVGDIAPLFALRVGPGRLGAAPDGIWLYDQARTAYGSKLRAYRTRFAHKMGTTYFNAGMLAFERSTWRTIGQDAWQFYRTNRADCLFHDQSALNMVVGDNVEWISPAYNFSTDYRMMGFELALAPRILHFTGPMKPWLVKYGPWGPKAWSGYQSFIAKHPSLRPYAQKRPAAQLKSMRNQFIMNVVEGAPGINRPLEFAVRWQRFRTMMQQGRFAIR